MNSSGAASFPSPVLVFLFLIFAPHLPAWAQVEPTGSPQTAFVFFQRTRGHARNSTPDVFKQVVDDIQGYLKANRVAVVIDVPSWGDELPLPAVQQMAHDSKAAYLLYVVIDRPATKWLKVTVQCYDAMGQQIWVEQSSAGREWSGGKGVRDVLRKLHEQLNKRLGQPGLLAASSEQKPPLTASGENPAAPAREGEDSRDIVRLANGTPVHLLVAEPVSSKTAKPGDVIKLQVLGDVKVGDLVVIANKAPGFATIETAKSAGRAWRTGTVALKLQTVTLLNQLQQPLRAWSAIKGIDTNAGVAWTNAVVQSYGFALLFLPLAPLQHGNEALLRRGTVLEAVINGDVKLPRAAIEAVQPKPAEPRQGPASVTIYYQEIGNTPVVEVWCGEVKIGRLRKGHRFTMTLPPGKYWLRTWKRDLTTSLDAEVGGEHYVNVIVSSEQIGGPLNTALRPHFSVVPHDVGEAQSADTTPAKSQDVLDVAKLDLAQLQADPHVKKK
jgi:hypothetical protein